MIKQSGTADVYTDFKGLADLRAQAAHNSPAALKEAAKQFESLFIQMSLKSMRKASSVLESNLTHGKAEKTYQDMYDQQLAIELSKRSPLGLAEVLTRQLGGAAGPKQALENKGLQAYRREALPAAPSNPASWRPPSAPLLAGERPSPYSPLPAGRAQRGGQSRLGVRAWNAPSASNPNPQSLPREDKDLSRENFVATLWPHAQAAASELGVDPKILLAQAALESNWGKSMPRGKEGVSSHNLFGIKADRRWEGDSLAASTTEYEGGQAVKQRAAFRAYDSYADSFRDYARFLQTNPRYAKALENAGNPARFIAGLQKAGYATDPNYARKVLSIYKTAADVLADAG
jgi:flagellar protein FlgJ